MILSILAFGCNRNEPFASGSGAKKRIGVVMVTDSALRLDPLATSARIAVLPTGENVEVTDRSHEKSPVAGKMDYWYKVRLRSGITGWIYGQNIKVFAEGEDSSVAKYAKELRKEEAEKVRKELKGKWWSVSGEDNFTDHIVSLREDGSYASLVRGSDKLTEGDYTIDTENSVVKFSNGTAFGDQLNYVIRGDFYVLEVITDKKKIKFKRISRDPNFKAEFTAEDKDADDKTADEKAPVVKNAEGKKKEAKKAPVKE
jgi:uncharacterized protein YgiM (DUF1202 family)